MRTGVGCENERRVRQVRRCARQMEARGDHAVLDGMRTQYMPMLSDYKVVSFAPHQAVSVERMNSFATFCLNPKPQTPAPKP